MHLLACQARVTVGESDLCLPCLCDVYPTSRHIKDSQERYLLATKVFPALIISLVC